MYPSRQKKRKDRQSDFFHKYHGFLWVASMLQPHLQLEQILSCFLRSEGPAGLTSVPSAGRGAAAELRAKA